MRNAQIGARSRAYDIFVVSFLAAGGLGVIAMFGFDMPAGTLFGPLVLVFFALFAAGILLVGRR